MYIVQNVYCQDGCSQQAIEIDNVNYYTIISPLLFLCVWGGGV